MEMLNVDRAAAYLRTADDCLIYIHTNPDGDAVGSGGALALALRRLGKRARVFCADEIPERLRFLTEAAADVPFTRTQDASATPLSVDVASAGQLGVSEAPHFALSIDHHAVNRIGCERLLLKSDYPAAGEIVYELLCALGLPLDRPLATLLYAAISSDSGGFRYSSTRPQTHLCAAKLLETGIDVGPVNKALFRTKSKTRLAMEARMVADMELYDSDRVVVMSIPLSLRQELHATEADIEELSSLAALVESTDCGITLRELKPGKVKLSLRTGPRVDACAVCQRLGGGGHKAAAGATVDGTLKDAKALVLQAYRAVVG